MSKDKFEMPAPVLIDAQLFYELEERYRRWVAEQEPTPKGAILAIMMRASAIDAINNGASKEGFLLLATETYERLAKDLADFAASGKERSDG